MTQILTRILIKISGEKNSIKECIDFDSLQTLQLELNSEFGNYPIKIGDTIKINSEKYKIVDVLAVADKTSKISEQYPFNFDLIYYVKKYT